MPQSPENSFGQATQSELFCLSALGVLVASGLMATVSGDRRQQRRWTAAAAMDGSSGDGRQQRRWTAAVADSCGWWYTQSSILRNTETASTH
jgi:hypothetical protein